MKFGQPEYTIVVSGIGGLITYKGGIQSGTFTVKAGDSVEISAYAYCVNVKMPKTAIIQLNGVTVASKTANQPNQTATATYTFTPSSDAEIIKSKESDNGSGKIEAYRNIVNIKTI